MKLNKIRDKLADYYVDETLCDVALDEQQVWDSFNMGFDTGVAEMKKIIEPLVRALHNVTYTYHHVDWDEHRIEINKAQKALDQYRKDIE